MTEAPDSGTQDGGTPDSGLWPDGSVDAGTGCSFTPIDSGTINLLDGIGFGYIGCNGSPPGDAGTAGGMSCATPSQTYWGVQYAFVPVAASGDYCFHAQILCGGPSPAFRLEINQTPGGNHFYQYNSVPPPADVTVQAPLDAGIPTYTLIETGAPTGGAFAYANAWFWRSPDGGCQWPPP